MPSNNSKDMKRTPELYDFRGFVMVMQQRHVLHGIKNVI